MAARKVKFAPSTKAELKDMVSDYFTKGGVIKVCPTRYAFGVYRATLTNTKKVTK